MIPTLSAEQKYQLNEDGFVVLENLFTVEEMNEVAERIESFQRRHEESLQATESGASGISRADEITFTDHLAEKDPAIRAFCERPEFVAISTQLLGPDIDLYWNQSVFKQPECAKEFPWHQDDGYGIVDPSPYLTLWLALNDATPENGCISVMPGSYKRGLIEHWESPIGNVCYSSDEADQGIRVPVKAGSLIVFWSLTFHKSGPNVSDGTRKAFVIQYAKSPLRNGYSGEVMEHLLPIARNGQPANQVESVA
jgi:ectoine hydroxylase-related dioxygenase (phytanoyl-CoA dioxygenase family)